MTENKNEPEDAVVIDVTPDEEPETDGKPPRQGSALRWVFGVVVILALAAFAAGIVFGPEMRSELAFILGEEPAPAAAQSPPAQTTPAIDAASSSRLDALENRLAALEATPLPTASADTTSLEDQQRQLQNQLDALRQQTAQLSDTVRTLPSTGGSNIDEGRLSALEQQVQTLINQVRATQTQLSRLESAQPAGDVLQPMTVVALSRLRLTVENGEAYQPALDGVKRLMVAQGGMSVGVGNALDTLEINAKTGVATTAALTNEFSTVAGAIVEADALPEDADWWDRTLASLGSVVTVRQTGEIEGSDTEARVARAEIALMKGNIAAAAEEIGALEGRAAKIATPWLEKARARVDALNALDGLETALLPVGGIS